MIAPLRSVRPQASKTIRLRRQAEAVAARRCRKKFLRYFKRGFHDPQFEAWERGYKWNAHVAWEAALSRDRFASLVAEKKWETIAREAIRIESRTNLLFSFEKMALRDGVRSRKGAEAFGRGLYALLHGEGAIEERFDAWCRVLAGLPRRQTRVLTWPVATVFGFLALPSLHFYLKPTVTRKAALEYGADFDYESRPSGVAYRRVLDFATQVRGDLADLEPRDMIDIQSFLWVQGSEEYSEDESG